MNTKYIIPHYSLRSSQIKSAAEHWSYEHEREELRSATPQEAFESGAKWAMQMVFIAARAFTLDKQEGELTTDRALALLELAKLCNVQDDDEDRLIRATDYFRHN